MKYVNIIVVLFLLIPLDSCKTRKKASDSPASTIKSWPVIESLKESEVISSYLQESQFIKSVDDIIRKGDKYLNQARLLIYGDRENEEIKSGKQRAVTSYSECAVKAGGNEAELRKCSIYGNIPLDAGKYLQAAIFEYLKVMNTFSIPIIKSDYDKLTKEQKALLVDDEFNIYPSADKVYAHLGYSSRMDPDFFTVEFDDLEEEEVEYFDQNGKVIKLMEKVDIWETALEDNKCAGVMSTRVRYLCEEYFLVLGAHQIASGYLGKFFKNEVPPEAECREMGAQECQYFNRFQKFFNIGNQLLARITEVYKSVSFKLNSINRGILGPNSVDKVSLKAIVGDPGIFVNKLTNLLSEYRSEVEHLYNAKAAVLNTEIQQLNSDAELKRMRNNLFDDTKKQEEMLKIDYAKSDKQLDYLFKKQDKIIKHIADVKRKFSVNFNAVFGRWSDKLKAVGPSAPITVTANGMKQKVEFKKDGSGNVMKGAISFTANSNTVTANGIYWQDWMRPRLKYLSIKSVSKGISNGYKKVVKTTNAGINSVKSAGSKLMKGGAVSLTGLGMGALGLGGGLGGLLGGKGKLPNINDYAKKTGKLFRPLTKVLFSFMEGALPGGGDSPVSLLEKIENDLANKPYPHIETHVYGYKTNVDGYVVSRSVSKSINVGKSQGTSKSVSTNIGMSVDVKPIGIGIGMSMGTSASMSRSDGISAGAGKSASMSMNVGFYSDFAELPTLRVGALAGVINCRNNEKRKIGIGLSNVLVIDDQLINDGCTSVELFINDNLIGAGKATCPDDQNRNKPCGEGHVAVSIQHYADQEQMFKKLYKIFASPEFQDILYTASFSSDPYGSIWRLFQNMALNDGVTKEEILSFKPVVDQYMAIAVNERELEQIALEIYKVKSDMNKVNIQKIMLKNKIALYDKLKGINAEIARKREFLKQLHREKEYLHSHLVDFNLDRIQEFYGLWRQSKIYHDPNSNYKNIPDILAKTFDLRKKMRRQLNANSSKADVKKIVGDVLQIATAINKIKDDQFLRNYMTFTEVGHCIISFKDLGLERRPREDRGTDNMQKFFLNAGAKDSPVVYFSKESPVAGDPMPNFGFDDRIAKKIRTSTSAGAPGGTVKSYYRIKVFTNPDNVQSSFMDVVPKNDGINGVENLQQTSKHYNNPIMRCDTRDRGMGKIVGIAFSYKLDNNDRIGSQIIWVSHDPLIWAYDDERDIRYYRVIEREDDDLGPGTADDAFFGNNGPKQNLTRVKLHLESDLIGNEKCVSTSGAQQWMTSGCMTHMLGEAYDAQSPHFKVAGVAKNFFNSYVGGAWDIYIPDNSPWNDYVTYLQRMKMHIFIKQRRGAHN